MTPPTLWRRSRRSKGSLQPEWIVDLAQYELAWRCSARAGSSTHRAELSLPHLSDYRRRRPRPNCTPPDSSDLVETTVAEERPARRDLCAGVAVPTSECMLKPLALMPNSDQR